MSSHVITVVTVPLLQSQIPQRPRKAQRAPPASVMLQSETLQTHTKLLHGARQGPGAGDQNSKRRNPRQLAREPTQARRVVALMSAVGDRHAVLDIVERRVRWQGVSAVVGYILLPCAVVANFVVAHDALASGYKEAAAREAGGNSRGPARIIGWVWVWVFGVKAALHPRRSHRQRPTIAGNDQSQGGAGMQRGAAGVFHPSGQHNKAQRTHQQRGRCATRTLLTCLGAG